MDNIKTAKDMQPGDMYNQYKRKMSMEKGKKKIGAEAPKMAYKKKKLRPASAVVKSEQNASHQFFKKKFEKKEEGKKHEAKESKKFEKGEHKMKRKIDIGKFVGGVGKAVGMIGKGIVKNTFGDKFGKGLKAQGFGKKK